MGRLIVLEGIDGSGKATQAALLEKYLQGRGQNPLKITFPNYASPSSALVKLYLGGEITKEPEGVNAYAASSFYAVDRYVSFKQGWEKDYLSGRTLIADRYTTSNITHQMMKLPQERWQAFADWLQDFEYQKLGLPRPSLVVYLDMHPAVSQRLMEGRYAAGGQKDIHERDTGYLLECRRAALYAAGLYHWRVVPCFDPHTMAPLPVEGIAAAVRQLVEAPGAEGR